MGDEYSNQGSDIATKVRDIEERQNLLKERTLLIGKGLLDEKERNSKEIQEIKKSLVKLQDETSRIKDLLTSIMEKMDTFARKEELAIIQRQFDILRKA
jgi:septal ring factor EnvC (AmiA/AmiB activator)